LDAIAAQSDSTLSALGSPDKPFEFMGRLQGANGQGGIDIYTYNEQYEDDAGVTQSIMGSMDVIGTGGAPGNALLRRDPRQAGRPGVHVALPENVGSGRPVRDLHDDAERTAHGPWQSQQQFRLVVA
jgi:hypothetical protein